MKNQRFIMGIGMLAAALMVPLAVRADDDAAASAYDDGWQTGDNGGTEFNAWTLAGGANAGQFTFTSTDNGDGDHTPLDNDIDTGSSSPANRSWGMYANSGGLSTARRAFSSSLPVGGEVSIAIDNGFIDTGATVGVALRNSSGEHLVDFYFTGGNSNYQLSDAGSSTFDSGAGYTDEGLILTFRAMAGGTYNLTINRIAGGSPSPITGRPLLNPAGGQTVAEIYAYNSNAGNGGTNNFYINQLKFSLVPVELDQFEIQ